MTKTFKIKVTDRRGQFPPKVYEVQASEEFLAYGPATEQFIAENKIPPYRRGESVSRYYARFWNEAI